MLQVDDHGRFALPPDLQLKLGPKQGDAVAVVETPDLLRASPDCR
jgi:hypothetical protein